MSICGSSPPWVFLGKGVLKICSKLTGEHSCQSEISIKLLCNLHIFRTPFPKNTFSGLLLYLGHYQASYIISTFSTIDSKIYLLKENHVTYIGHQNNIARTQSIKLLTLFELYAITCCSMLLHHLTLCFRYPGSSLRNQ